MKIFEELRRRNVFRVGGVYGVAGWLIAQAAGVFENSLNMPGWFDTVIVSALLLGFPVAMILAWAFEMTPDGVKLTANVAAGESIAPKTGRRLDYAILGGLALVGAMIVADRLTPETAAPVASTDAGSAADGAAEVSAASIAVLPFADLSPSKDQEYFSDGIAEEILNALAHVDGLNVASRTSSFAFKGRAAAKVPEIASELKVRHVLEGSVRKAGASLRITAQLIDAEADRHLWSQTYDRPLTAENVFAIQEEIAGAIVAALGGVMKMEGAPAPAVEVVKATNDLSAYDLYLKARDYYQRRENIGEAEALLGAAVERDPNFADAWALRAAANSLYREYVNSDLPLEEIERRVEEYASQALELDPDSALAIAARSNFRLTATWSLLARYDIGDIIADLEQAVSLDPRDSSARNWLGMSYLLIGDTRRALETFTACAEFDPMFGPCNENAYDVLAGFGRYDEARARFETVLSRGIRVGGWVNFSLLVHFDEKAAFMMAANHPQWLPGWRRQDEIYEAYKNPGADHSALLAAIADYTRDNPRANQQYVSLGIFLIPIGAFDLRPFVTTLWGLDHARYRKSPQFRDYIIKTGVDDYWRKHGFPPQCRPKGKDDFECD